jgi:hypothetical protein
MSRQTEDCIPKPAAFIERTHAQRFINELERRVSALSVRSRAGQA